MPVSAVTSAFVQLNARVSAVTSAFVQLRALLSQTRVANGLGFRYKAGFRCDP